MGGEYNIKMSPEGINLAEFEPQAPSGETVYAQALDGANQDVYSLGQGGYHDKIYSQIAPEVIQTGAAAPVPQGFQSAYIQPIPVEVVPSWVKYGAVLGLGYFAFKFLRRN